MYCENGKMIKVLKSKKLLRNFVFEENIENLITNIFNFLK